MYEIDFLPVGDGERSGDAIAMRFTRPDTGGIAQVIIDAGFQDDGEALVEHVNTYYDSDYIDLAILTHPDGDHIGGMGVVVRKLRVGALLVNNIGARGGSSLPAADAVDDLIRTAEEQGTKIYEPFSGTSAFGGALTVLGPDVDYYEELVAAQVPQEVAKAAAAAARPPGPLARLALRALGAFPLEIPFDDREGDTPRNNSSVVTLLEVDGFRALFTADAGVPALERAWDWLEKSGREVRPPELVQIPHHGSRKNGSSMLLDRLLGQKGQAQTREAIVSVSADAPRHPYPHIVNAYGRRGYQVGTTAGRVVCFPSPGLPRRPGWVTWSPLPPLDESEE